MIALFLSPVRYVQPQSIVPDNLHGAKSPPYTPAPPPNGGGAHSPPATSHLQEHMTKW